MIVSDGEEGWTVMGVSGQGGAFDRLGSVFGGLSDAERVDTAAEVRARLEAYLRALDAGELEATAGERDRVEGAVLVLRALGAGRG